MGMKPRGAKKPPKENVPRLLMEVVEAFGPCLDGCPSDMFTDGYCIVCRCENARHQLLVEHLSAGVAQ